MAKKSAFSLYDAKKSHKCRVKSIPDIPLLESLGISTDTIVTVNNKYAFGGPVLLKVDTAMIAVGKDVAEQILVEEVVG
ncbi:MAG: ferrous iron transport protein A [Syntrophomonadaceae bacterium]|nr:ferrous iron transport protein A [Syntrophomonadaceae bacterium]